MYEIILECTGRYHKMRDWKNIIRMEANRKVNFKCPKCHHTHSSYLTDVPIDKRIREILAYLYKQHKNKMIWYEWASEIKTKTTSFLGNTNNFQSYTKGEMAVSIENFQVACQIFNYRCKVNLGYQKS